MADPLDAGRYNTSARRESAGRSIARGPSMRISSTPFCRSFAVAAFTLFAAAPAEARIYDGGITHQELQELLIDAGLQAVTVDSDSKEPDAVPTLAIMGGAARWHVQFMACKEGRCADLHFSAGYDLEVKTPATTVDDVNGAMLPWLSANMYIDEEDDPIFQADVNTDGVSGRNIQYSARVFDAMVRCVSHRVGFDDAPAACEGLEDRFTALSKQSIASEDVSRVRISTAHAELGRILRANGFSPTADKPQSGRVSWTVNADGVIWTAAVPESAAEQMNGSILLVAVCNTCTQDTERRANAYNAQRRWLTADAQQDLIVATMTLPLSGGVTEGAIGMMFRSFHGWVKNLGADMPD